MKVGVGVLEGVGEGACVFVGDGTGVDVFVGAGVGVGSTRSALQPETNRLSMVVRSANCLIVIIDPRSLLCLVPHRS